LDFGEKGKSTQTAAYCVATWERLF